MRLMPPRAWDGVVGQAFSTVIPCSAVITVIVLKQIRPNKPSALYHHNGSKCARVVRPFKRIPVDDLMFERQGIDSVTRSL